MGEDIGVGDHEVGNRDIQCYCSGSEYRGWMGRVLGQIEATRPLAVIAVVPVHMDNKSKLPYDHVVFVPGMLRGR